MQLLTLLQSNLMFYYFIVFIVGLVMGSFLNVVIYRLPTMMFHSWRNECRELLEMDSDSPEVFNLARPASRCQHCGHAITAIENIPVLSYLFLGGKCSACKQPISIRYPIVELISGMAALLAAIHFGVTLQALLAILLSWALIVLTLIDLDHQLLPDSITLPFLWLGILANMFGIFTDIHSSLIGVMAGYLSLWSVYMLFKLVTGKEGMGFGDFKLLAMLGAWLGWQFLPLIIVLSSLVGALSGIGLMLLRNHARSQPIPFGPFLAVAGWIALFYGDSIMQAYYGWLLGGP